MSSRNALYEVDLHCHTTASDGLLTPRELVRMAAEIGLKGIGITDHDTIQGWAEAEEAGVQYKIEVLQGVELNTDWNGQEVHILGYALDNTSAKLNEQLKSLREARELRMQDILKCLATLDIELHDEEVRKLSQGDSIGRPHIAQALVERGIVRDTREAFERYLGRGAPAYVPRYKISTEEGIRLVREAQGVAVLAHPGMQGLDDEIPVWAKMGLQGLEVRHSEHSEEDVRRYAAIAQQYELIMTGGSDFHGEIRKPGVELGEWGVPLTVLRQIQRLSILNKK
ncbi:histidinol phosphatase [Desulfosporosinus sp. HMP52]|uniref:PHP domain-containing protein n=1 Tax=Desulfosporosinus sp. HMP52 TaxID=1487923 RepID=UPI00051FD275|nr:PHP domain-containing protein [Desulfosporosinus sp. HMP52]KGK86685.1 histidinol phosphatase [Desulfosporosinus sp. HMP52]